MDAGRGLFLFVIQFAMNLVVCNVGSWPLFKNHVKNASLIPDRRIIPRQDAGIMDNGRVDVIR